MTELGLPDLTYALVQFNAVVGDVAGNRDRISQEIERAFDSDADLVVFPELALSGYPPEDLLYRKSFITQIRDALDQIAIGTTRRPEAAVLVGFPERDGARLYNSAAVIRNGAIEQIYRKQNLPNYGVFDEVRYFTPGEANVTLELQRQTVGVTICEDIWVESSPLISLADDGAQLVVNLSASPYHRGKGLEREALVAERARAANIPVLLCNLVGGQDELIFDGHSCAVNADGTIVARAPQFQEAVLEGSLTGGARSTNSTDNLLTEPEEIYEALKLGIRDYFRKNGFQHAVFGLSGGIDSGLVACLAADALGPDNVTSVVMPSPFSSGETQADAREQSRKLGIECVDLKIDPVMAAYEETLADLFRGREKDLTEENLQARIRGNILMALSNKFGWLVLTTGNKSEFSVGYATLYGDMAGGLAAIKDCPKTLVYELSEYRNQLPDAPIPRSIIDRPPTAELREGQLDSDSLPPYEVLDPILEGYVEESRDLAELVSLGHPPDVVERVIRLVDLAEYKRRQSPPGIKITPLAFGRDRRMPITNRFRSA